MKKLVTLFLVIVSFCLFTGCGSTYLIKLKNGVAYETPKKPEMNEEGEYMTIEGPDGKEVYIKKDEILAIEQK